MTDEKLTDAAKSGADVTGNGKNGIAAESAELNVPEEAQVAGNSETVDLKSGNGKTKCLKPDKARVVAVIKKLLDRWFIKAFTGMAQGLFCTLIAGTILAQIGGWITSSGTEAGIAVGNFVTAVANIAKSLMGAGIGVGMAHELKAPKLVMFSAAVAGMAGAFSDQIIAGTYAASFAPGNPIGTYVVALIAIEIGLLVAGKTKVDIVVVPLTMMVVSMLAVYVAYPFILFVNLIGKGIALATGIAPISMGIIIAVAMGILLTLPTSSAAIWLVIAGGAMAADPNMLIAGGAATAGCAAHMVGFAVQSFRENKWGGLIAQGIGTSMLQIPNLMRHPLIMVPPIVASAIVGPLATSVFRLRCTAAGGGMGTSGLVGVFGVIDASAGLIPDWQIALGIIFCMFVIPAVVCFAVSEIMRKMGWIKFNDMKLEL